MRTLVSTVVCLFLFLPTDAFCADSGDETSLLAAVKAYTRLVARLGAATPHNGKELTAGSYRPTFTHPNPRGRGVMKLDVDPPFADEIKAAALRHGIRPSFLFAIVEVESNYDHTAQSHKGARGLGQVMPTTAIEVGIHPDQLWHPSSNLEASARYIRWLADRYRGDIDNILIGYNAGPAVADGRRRVPRETRAYIVRVKNAYRRHRGRDQSEETRSR